MTLTTAGRRIDRTAIFFVVIAVLGAITLLWLGRGMTFFSDEWAFIETRSLTDVTTWLPPHNEHWVTLPVIAYRALVETVGLGSYVPYQLVLVALHVIVAAFVFRLVRRVAGDPAALIAATIVVFFGDGFENLYWGFQIGFVGATAAGLATLDVLDGPATRPRAVTLVALLVVALMTAGNALFFLAVVGVELLLRRDRLRWLPLLIVPTVIYAGWFLTIGKAGIGVHRDPFTFDAVLQVPEFVVRGVGNAFGGVTGVGPIGGLLVASMVIALAVRTLVHDGRLPPRFVAAMAGVVIEYAMIALTRAGVTPDQVYYTRYTYTSGVLVIVGVASLIGPDVRRLLPTPGRGRLTVVTIGTLTLVLALLWNVRLLIGGRDLFLERAQMTRALVTVAIDPNRPAGVDLDRSLVLVPSPAALERIVGAWGTPLSDSLVPWAVEPIRPEILAEAKRRLIYGAPIPGVTD